jgi:hypothetical protein
MAVLCVPFLILLSQRLVLESFVWVGAALGFLAWEVRQMARQLRSVADADVLYIGDDDGQSMSTRNYDLHLRA